MLATAVIVLISSFYFPPNIFWLMLFIGTVFASSWGPIGFMSIWSKRITADAAFWGIVTGFVFNVVPAGLEYIELISFPVYFSPVVIGVTASLVTITTMSRLTKVSRAEAVYRMRLHRTPDVDSDLKKTKTTLLAPAFLVARHHGTAVRVARKELAGHLVAGLQQHGQPATDRVTTAAVDGCRCCVRL